MNARVVRPSNPLGPRASLCLNLTYNKYLPCRDPRALVDVTSQLPSCLYDSYTPQGRQGACQRTPNLKPRDPSMMRETDLTNYNRTQAQVTLNTILSLLGCTKVRLELDV